MATVRRGGCWCDLLPFSHLPPSKSAQTRRPAFFHGSLQEFHPRRITVITRRRRIRNCCSLSIGPTRPRASLHHIVAVLSAADQACDSRFELELTVGSEIIPHPEKVEKGGEDAFFLSNYNGGVLGVADGVSGWAEENVDPALFARELMEHAAAAVGSEEIKNCPQLLLGKAHEATSATGAATAIVAILERKGGILHIANLGDCGLRIVRKGKVVFATRSQEHYFDCPYQLSSEEGAQTSADATVYDVHVMEDDTIVMGSDGLFDNVYDRDIEATVSQFHGHDRDAAQRTATALASLARKHANDPKFESPYSQEAILQGYDVPWWKKVLGQKLTGGKLDDITVLIANVVSVEVAPEDESNASTYDDAVPSSPLATPSMS